MLRKLTAFAFALLAWPQLAAQSDLQSLVYRAPAGGYSGLEGTVTIYDKSHAVVIGISNYSSLPRLAGAVRDAQSMAEVLKKQGFEVTLMTDGEATRSRIAEELGDRLPVRLGRNDRVMIYFAGHGVTVGRENAPMGYLMPVEGDNQRRVSTGISMREIQAWIAAYRSKHVLFAADACYSGLALTTRSTGLPDTLSDYLRQVTEREVRLAFTAGRADQEAHEWRGQGLFTFFFLKALEGEADSNFDGIVTSAELDAYLGPNVAQTALDNWRAEQNPQVERSGQGEFVFLVPRNLPAAVRESPREPSEQAEITFWKSIEDSPYAEDFQAYLKKFPAGLFADLAQVKIARLTQSTPAHRPEPSSPSDKPAVFPADRGAPDKPREPVSGPPASVEAAAKGRAKTGADANSESSARPDRVVGQARTKAELDAWTALQQESDAPRRIQLEEAFLKSYPDSGLTPFAHYDLAILYRQTDPEKFILHGEAALREIPELPDILAYLAFYYSETERTQEALDRAERALEMLDGMSKPSQLSDLAWVTKKHEFKAEAYYALGRARLNQSLIGSDQASRARRNEAAANFQLAIRHAPAHPYASFRLAEAHVHLGQVEEALEAYARTVAIGGVIGQQAEKNIRELYRQIQRSEEELTDLIARQRRQLEADLASFRQSIEREANPSPAPTLRRKPG